MLFKKTLNFQFCSVFIYEDKLYLAHEKKVNGPRCMIFPPQPLEMLIDPNKLGELVFDALNNYIIEKTTIYAPEWELLNKQLLTYFGSSSIFLFERKKKEVTIRRDVTSGDIELFVGTTSSHLGKISSDTLGHAILEKLNISQA